MTGSLDQPGWWLPFPYLFLFVFTLLALVLDLFLRNAHFHLVQLERGALGLGRSTLVYPDGHFLEGPRYTKYDPLFFFQGFIQCRFPMWSTILYDSPNCSSLCLFSKQQKFPSLFRIYFGNYSRQGIQWILVSLGKSRSVTTLLGHANNS